MSELKAKYEALSREYHEACDRAWELKQQVEDAYAAMMEEETGIKPGDLVEYDDQRGIFDQWMHSKASKMTLVKKDGTVGKAIRYITNPEAMKKVVISKMEITTQGEA